jgi:hypothetical protein
MTALSLAAVLQVPGEAHLARSELFRDSVSYFPRFQAKILPQKDGRRASLPLSRDGR